MQTFTLDLWEGFSYSGEMKDDFRRGTSALEGLGGGPRPTLDAYLLKSEAPRPAVLVLPGSGYVQCSPREAEALALRFNAAGCHSFVLWYSCAPRRHPVPLLDCARALTIIRSRAKEWKLDPDRLAMMGFSAGGHLALSETLFYREKYASAPGSYPEFGRVDALILCYPVISSGEFAHRGSFDALLGESPDPALLKSLSLENQIPSGLPPVFLWHTYPDQSVPVENSLLLAGALRKQGIPLEMHIFPEGKHGLSLAIRETALGEEDRVDPHVAQWFPLCLNWVKKQFGI
jgi:acetyl esterase/lipase